MWLVQQSSVPQFLCTNLSYNMTVGSRDYNTEGEVTKLQIFLVNAGFLNHSVTGYFGVLTRSAVANYQAANGIVPTAGYVGPVTRAAINKDTCSGYVPSDPSNNPSYYCTVNGISYLNENDYKNNCVSVTYYYICTINGQTYSSQAEYNAYCKTGGPNVSVYVCPINNVVYYDLATYNANCKPQTSTYYCSINGQTYYNINDYNNYCKNTGSLPSCNLNTIYSSTNSCACPSGYTFMNVSNGYKCDNSNYACTMIYVPPYATSPTYDRCHYSNYCQYDGLYYNDASYCKNNNGGGSTLPVCNLNTTYGATNSCACPSGYTFMSVSGGYRCDNGNYACTAIYVDPSSTSPTYDRCHYPYYCSLDGLYHNNASYCKAPTQNYTCALNYEYQGGGFVATNDCTCPVGSTRVSLGNFGEIYKWKCVSNY